MQPGEDLGGYHPRNPRAGDVIDPNPDNTIDPASVNVTADAGQDQAVDEGTQVWLDGSLSTGDGALSYTWFQVAGTTVELTGYDQPMASFTAPPPLAESEVLQFRLMVRVNTDVADGVSVQPVVKSDTDDVQVVVRRLDFDGDGLAGAADNCPQVSNPAQEDADGDGAGDACDLCPNDAAKTEPGLAGCGNPEPADPSAADTDDDGVPDDTDNCPDTPNADQADCDTNGVGNACQAVPTPLVTVTWSPASPTVGDAVTFQANPAAQNTSCMLDWYLANGGRLTWDFGDGKIAEGSPVSTVYDSSGTYTVKLSLVLTALGLGTLSCDQGLTDGSCKQVSVPKLGATVVPIIAEVADHAAAIGVAYTIAPTLTQGTAPVSWSLVAGPANMTVNTTTGQVSWPNPVAGTHTVTIRATGTTGSDDETWVLTVQALPVIADVPDHSAVADTPYSRSPTVTQGSTPVTWSLVSGPSGVTVNASNGAVAWPSPVVGASTITIRATNAIGSDYESWTLTVSANAPVIADIPDHTITAGSSYSRTPSLVRGTAPVTWSLISGPAGMSANSSSGVVSWAAQTAGTYVVTIRASNAAGSDDESWTLTLPAVAPVIAGVPDHMITTNSAYSRTPSLVQGTAPVTWSLISGPTGMSANPSSGVVSWAAQTVGTYVVTIRATNNVGSDDETWTLTVNVQNAPVAIPTVLRATVNTPKFVMLTGRDVSGRHSLDPVANALQFKVISPPTHGTLSGTAPQLIYTPVANYQGKDSFAFTVKDATSTSASAAISINVQGWSPPRGIPDPRFGIHEEPPPSPTAWPAAQSPGNYYIDNSHPNATDNDNAYGCPTKPRMTIPNKPILKAGSVMELRGGPYVRTLAWIAVNTDAEDPPTAANPAFIRGPSITERVRIKGDESLLNGRIEFKAVQYLIVENLVFDNYSVQIVNNAHHLALRHSEFTNTSSNLIAMNPNNDMTISDIVVYNCLIHDTKKWSDGTDDWDYHGIGVTIWGRTNAFLHSVWILDNEFFHTSGDAVQVVARTLDNIPNLHHVYIGRNRASWNRQSGFWCKQASHVIVSENKASGMRMYGPNGLGQGLGYQYGPDKLWFIFNEISDCRYGLRQSDTSDPVPDHEVFIIGNLFHDIRPQEGDTYHFTWSEGNFPWRAGVAISLWSGNQTRYVVGNTIYNCQGGISAIHPGPLFLVNNIIANVSDDDAHISICRNASTTGTQINNCLISQQGASSDGFIRWGDSRTRHTVMQFQNLYPDASSFLLNGDPFFTDPGDSDLSLSVRSPAIDAGVRHAAYQRFQDLYGLDISVDIAGIARPQGSGYDIGAYERTAD